MPTLASCAGDTGFTITFSFFVVNNAIDAQGKVVFLDFGETAFDMTIVAQMVENRTWGKKDVLIKETLPPEYHEYYFQAMTSRLSGQNFELHWASDLDDLDKMIIQKPTLSERPEDIPALVERILDRANQEEGWNFEGVSRDVIDLLIGFGWRKNGGLKLQNVLYLAAKSCRTPVIQTDDLPRYFFM